MLNAVKHLSNFFKDAKNIEIPTILKLNEGVPDQFF